MEKIFYLAQVFGTLNAVGHVVFILFTLIFCITACVYFGFRADDDEDGANTAKSASKVSFVAVIIGLLLTCFVPSKETYLFMVGGKVVDSAIEQNPSVKDLPGNTLQLLNEYIVSKTEGIRNKE